MDTASRSQAAIASALTAAIYADLKPPVVDEFLYGAFWLDPGLLTIKYLFATAADLAAARANGTCAQIEQRAIAALAQAGYPARALPRVSVGFAAQADVATENGPWNYFR